MKRGLLALALVLVAQNSFAGVLTLEPGAKSIEGVNVAKSATANLDGNAVALSTLGAGVRTKKVLVATVKVYVAQLFGSQADKFNRDAKLALDSISKMPASAIQLTFLRSVDAETVQTSFKDALDANDVSLNKPEIAAFLKAVANSGDASEKKSLTILVETSESADTVTYEGTSGSPTVIRGPKGFGKDVMSIWLGEAADSGVEKLKIQLLQGV